MKKKPTATVIKNDLKYYKMSNTCIAKPNLEVFKIVQ